MVVLANGLAGLRAEPVPDLSTRSTDTSATRGLGRRGAGCPALAVHALAPATGRLPPGRHRAARRPRSRAISSRTGPRTSCWAACGRRAPRRTAVRSATTPRHSIWPSVSRVESHSSGMDGSCCNSSTPPCCAVSRLTSEGPIAACRSRPEEGPTVRRTQLLSQPWSGRSSDGCAPRAPTPWFGRRCSISTWWPSTRGSMAMDGPLGWRRSWTWTGWSARRSSTLSSLRSQRIALTISDACGTPWACPGIGEPRCDRVDRLVRRAAPGCPAAWQGAQRGGAARHRRHPGGTGTPRGTRGLGAHHPGIGVRHLGREPRPAHVPALLVRRTRHDRAPRGGRVADGGRCDPRPGLPPSRAGH